MFAKLGMALVGVLATGGIMFFAAAGGGSSAQAADPTDPSAAPSTSALPDPSRDFREWLHQTIIRSAAEVIGIRDEDVRERLRNGFSLAEIGRHHGVGEDQLERGILRDERQDLDRLVDAGIITPQRARDIMQWLTNHIEEIVHHHNDFGDLVTPPA